MKRRHLLLASLCSAFLAPFSLAADANPVVEIKTSEGLITVELFKDKAPLSVENFLKYVDKKFYDKTVFHRVMSTFMIQGGGFAQKEDGNHEQKVVDAPIKNEASNGLKNDRGTLAMARTGNPDSATSQFFINVVDNAGLNRPSPDGHGYAVFGKVTSGMDVVEKIKEVAVGTHVLVARGPDGATHPTPMQNVPVKDVVIESITLKGAPAAAPAKEEPAKADAPKTETPKAEAAK
jgi:peptidyl-prolyl cis-trans isomerase A (cyclophilin A)